jgi:hypothetical protein
MLSKQGSDACLPTSNFGKHILSVPYSPNQHENQHDKILVEHSEGNNQSKVQLRAAAIETHRLSDVRLSKQRNKGSIPSRMMLSPLAQQLQLNTESPQDRERVSVLEQKDEDRDASEQ